MAKYRLVMRAGPTVGRVFPLEGDEFSIGRDVSNKISINDGEISRKHARLIWQGEGYRLEDFGSTNGTFVNGQRLSGSTALKVGDIVALGENVTLFYESDIDPDATMLSSRSKRSKAAAPAPAPVPVPVPNPEPAPVYSGQVPASPVIIPAEPAKKSRKTLLIIIGVLLVLCICSVAVFLWFAPTSFWCALPFVQWGPGQCP